MIPILDDPLFRAPVGGFEFLERRSGWRALEDGRRQPRRHLGPAARGALRHAPARGRARHGLGRVRVPEGQRAGPHQVHDPRAELAPHLLAPRVLDRRVPDPGGLPRGHRPHPARARGDRLVELGCDYIQMDAPNYAQWHVDPDNRAAFEEHGHDMAHELVADAEIDNRVFDGVSGVPARSTCAAAMRRAASGPRRRLQAISAQVFPRLTNSTGCCSSTTRPRRQLRAAGGRAAAATRSCSGS